MNAAQAASELDFAFEALHLLPRVREIAGIHLDVRQAVRRAVAELKRSELPGSVELASIYEQLQGVLEVAAAQHLQRVAALSEVT